MYDRPQRCGDHAVRFELWPHVVTLGALDLGFKIGDSLTNPDTVIDTRIDAKLDVIFLVAVPHDFH
ncbi:MAG: hypothetical protein AAB638_03280 [Patescibacteria group bacterium]